MPASGSRHSVRRWHQACGGDRPDVLRRCDTRFSGPFGPSNPALHLYSLKKAASADTAFELISYSWFVTVHGLLPFSTEHWFDRRSRPSMQQKRLVPTSASWARSFEKEHFRPRSWNWRRSSCFGGSWTPPMLPCCPSSSCLPLRILPIVKSERKPSAGYMTIDTK